MMRLELLRAGSHRFFAVATVLLAACASSADAPHAPANIAAFAGSGQNGFAGLSLTQPLVVQVTAADATPVAGQVVDFTVPGGLATTNPTSATTDADGKAQTVVTIGAAAGTVVIVATVHATSLSVVFTAVAQAATNAACTGVTPVALTVGETRTSVAGSSICLTNTGAAEYLVHAFFASSVPSAKTVVGITGFGITTPAGSPAGSSPAPVAGGGGVLTLSAKAGNVVTVPDPARQLDLQLRELERTVLAPRMASARAAMRRRSASFATVPPTVGQILPFNVGLGCSSATASIRGGRVVAVTNSAIVVADTGNPTDGFTDAEYQSFGVAFDTLVNPLDTAAFGAPTDIDGNGHIILFYTRAVNERTPAGGAGGFIEGYFNSRDLFPTTATPSIQACTGSNVAEMFYVIVPDPAGTINGNVHTKASVLGSTVGVTAHEYQHLINAARRIYVNNADAFEEVWLNEGLSHMAEELIYYRAAGLTPRQNINQASVRTSQKRVDAFNQYMGGDISLYQLFLRAPTTSSPYANNDSLETRGATWAFLRYAADHQGTSDGVVWQLLVNSQTTGLQNLTNVFGASILDRVRDWSISVYTDDQTTTTAGFQGLSWNMRSLFTLFAPAFPLAVSPLTNGTQLSRTVSAGGSVYATIGVPNGVTAAAVWSVTSTSVQISIVRTK